jgi:photosystem II stability/assembly factor-like uncharacterized protein
MSAVLGIGTMKGAWFARSDDRVSWQVDGPYLKGWEVTSFGQAPGGDYLLGTGSSWYGAAIHRSPDLTDWGQIVASPSYEGSEDRKLARIWTIATSGDRLYAGVADAGLFTSDDDATTWHPVPALNDHPTRSAWQPGLGGLALHRVLCHPSDPDRVWVAISAVGVFATEDGGATWELRNTGVTSAGPTEEHDVGYCVHCITADPDDPDTIWRQDHKGVYRTSDGGRSWEKIQNGIPGAGFGFPVARDRASGRLFLVPLESDEYRMPVDGNLRVYRSEDRGDSWHASGTGLPHEPTYSGVLRGAMDVDGGEPGGIYFGTTTGDVWASIDTGDSWFRLPGNYPRITSIKVLAA